MSLQLADVLNGRVVPNPNVLQPKLFSIQLFSFIGARTKVHGMSANKLKQNLWFVCKTNLIDIFSKSRRLVYKSVAITAGPGFFRLHT